MTTIKLYEFEPTRSARCRWALLEAGLEYESMGGSPDIIGTDEVKKIHPLGKIPAAVIDGKPLFESAAIATAIADLVPEKNLVAKHGTWERTLHDQWTQFVLTELEAWQWANFINTVLLPEDQRISACLEQNAGMFRRGASLLEQELSERDYLIENRFTVTDIIVGFTLNAGRKNGYIDGMSNLHAYLERLFSREHCTLNQA